MRYGQEILNAPGTPAYLARLEMPRSPLVPLTSRHTNPLPGGFFTKLVPVVVENFSDAFPELLAKKEFVMAVIADEESSFNRTLDQVRACVDCVGGAAAQPQRGAMSEPPLHRAVTPH